VEPSGAPWRVLETAGPAAPPERPTPGGLPWLAVAAVLVLVALLGGGALLAMRPDAGVVVDGAEQPSAAGIGTDATTRAAADGSVGSARPAASAGSELVVEVGGAVQRPGVYHLPGGARVGDAIEAAGGYAARIDAALADRQLNLAAPLHDGEEVHVPARGEQAASGGAPGANAGRGSATTSGGAAAGPIDLNAATAEQLDTLPGIGPVTAAKIVAARDAQRFASVDELGTRKVVGAATLAKIRPLVTVGP